ncbi:hypothetical protein V3C99_014477 [Haemonchus contortus]
MQSDDPAFLPPGTEVSAKFKGAFCEAKIKKLCKSVKCKILLKEAPFGTLVVEEHLVRGTLEVNQNVEVSHGKQLLKGIIQHVKDCSTYNVVFNDGDEKVLRRTQMCLKGARHFDSESNLDQMPLYNPEQFCAAPKPQTKTKKAKKTKRRKDDDSEDDGGKKRKKRAAASAASVAIGEMDQGDTEGSGDVDMSGSDDESSDGEVEVEKDDKKKKEKKDEDDKKEDTNRKSSQAQKTEANRLEEIREKLRDGVVVCVYEDSQHRGKWFPAVVVNQKAYRDANVKFKGFGKNEIPLRNFQNGKYLLGSLANLTLFEDQPINKKVLDSMSNAQRLAVDRANSFQSKGALPSSWTAKEIYADTSPRRKDSAKSSFAPKTSKKEEVNESSKKDDDSKKKKPEPKKAESSSSSESSDEEEYGEERDLFVAQLYKFQEERGTPINRAPILGGKDIDLYRFYRVVQDYGGCKRVTTNQLWRKVLCKLHLEGCPGATPVTVRKAYIRYLAHFNSFYKRLGWSLDELSITSTINSPRERRLIRPAELLNQKPVKRKKSTASETKEKATKKGKEKSEGADSKETSRDPEPSTSRERSVSSPVSSVHERSKKADKDDDGKKSDRKQKDEEVKEKIDKKDKKEADKKDKKEKVKEKEKEKDKEKEKEKEEKTKEKDEKGKAKREEKAKEVEDTPVEKVVEKSKERPEIKTEREFAATVSSPIVKPEPESLVSPQRLESEQDVRDKPMASEKGSVIEKKELDVSDEDGDGKRKKERKKVQKSEKKSGDVNDPSKSKDADEGYRPANIVSRFYLGQKVRAHHHGRWYDARVVTVEQPSVKEMVEIMEMHDEEGTGLSSLAIARLRVVLNSTRCFVHYLGWNSRYDESITLNKIRISEKDDMSSLDAFGREMGERIPKSRLDFLLRWSNSTDGVESLTRDDVTTPSSLFSMGGYRPRRVSISQYEQLSAAAAEGLKRESSKLSGAMKVSQHYRAKTPTSTLSKAEHAIASSASSIGISPPLRSPQRSYEATLSSPRPPNVSSPPPIIPMKRSRTISSASSGRESVTTTSASPTPVPATIYIATSNEKILSPPRPIVSPPISLEEVSNDFELCSKLTASPENEECVFCFVDKAVIRESVSSVCREPLPKEKKKPQKATQAKQKTPIDDVSETGCVVTAHCYFELSAKNVPDGAPEDAPKEVVTDEHLRKTVVSVEYKCPREEIKQEVEVKAEGEASVVPQTPTLDLESDAEPSGSGTPLRTDGEDNDKWSTSDNQSAAGCGRMMSPGRGRGCKRKRAPYNRHSTMVIDRKYIRTKAGGKEERRDDDSYGEEEEEECMFEATRDTFISMKNKTYRLMEQEGSLDNYEILGLPPLDPLALESDDAVEIIEKRLSELREIYHQSKAELLLMEKKRRKRAEKRRERERASREAMAAADK